MKTRYIAMAITSALLTVGFIPLGAAQPAPRNAPEGIEVITVVGKRPIMESVEFVASRPAPEGIEVVTVVGKRPAMEAIELVASRPAPEGIEVVTVVGKRPEPTVASICVNEVIAGRIADNRGESRFNPTVDRASVRQAIKDCIDQSRLETHS